MIPRFRLFIFIGLAFILGSKPCCADLGETFDQMLRHYKQLDPDEMPDADHPNELFTCSLLKGSYYVTATFENGVLTSEIITKLDHSRFSSAEITNFLNENSSAHNPWEGPILIDESLNWRRGDGAFLAYDFRGNGGAFIILDLVKGSRKSASHDSA